MHSREVKQHRAHGWVRRDTSHIRNVSFLHTHYLMDCRVTAGAAEGCGFMGWVEFSEVDRAGE
ncbi:hypothetical protein QEH42_gp182 [Microbacterium phage Pumpernickel]|uniref:Uncharacterized protein n=1 Tax=Microbacterium phage Pumpernickel TaxID=2885983 RepID=A0AAE9C310_9CAUD|nr:hypothetical protein QEH42_gp182 [Microbacterium phage Pumpernickel]UDL16036.1 hypothetical protein SEA_PUMPERNICKEL_286 [Microbacterium phage Pumpernickel]